MKILICDDDTMTLRALKFQFQKEGFEIFQANNGREAQTILTENDISVLITDIYMPMINGLELITYVRKNLRRDMPIVIVSRVNVEDTIAFAKELGANDYHTKPINLENVLKSVKQLMKIDGEN